MTSASVCRVTGAVVRCASAIRRAMTLRRSTWPPRAAVAFPSGPSIADSCRLEASITSRSTIRPDLPLPFSDRQSIPPACAARRARGLMAGVSCSCGDSVAVPVFAGAPSFSIPAFPTAGTVDSVVRDRSWSDTVGSRPGSVLSPAPAATGSDAIPCAGPASTRSPDPASTCSPDPSSARSSARFWFGSKVSSSASATI